MFKKIKNWIEERIEEWGVKIIQRKTLNGFGAEDYFDHIFISSIKEFCERALKEDYIQKYNPDFKEVYEETIKLISEADWTYNSYFLMENKKRSKARKYIIKNIGYYWN